MKQRPAYILIILSNKNRSQLTFVSNSYVAQYCNRLKSISWATTQNHYCVMYVCGICNKIIYTLLAGITSSK